MWNAIMWGLVQGLTEFLPVSSSGHLVLVPAFLDTEPPDLATSAVLHLGTLAAVLAYYRADLVHLTAFRSDREARHIVKLLIVGTIPAVAGVLVRDLVSDLQESTTAVSLALLATGLVLFASGFVRVGVRSLEEASAKDALLIGLSQALALIPGISRSGMTITTGMARQLDRVEAARFSFLLAIPAIAGAGFLEGVEILRSGGIPAETWVATGVAAVSGYAAIALLIRVLARIGLQPFALYAVAIGTVGLVAL